MFSRSRELIAALTGEDTSISETNRKAHLSNSALRSDEQNSLTKIGMHNTSEIKEVGIHDDVRISRPTNRQLGTYLSKGYKPFIDVLSGKYFVIRREEPSILLYDPRSKYFEQVGPEALFIED